MAFLIEKVDADGSGEIDCDEFLMLMQDVLKESDTEEGLIEAFKTFDRDMGGDITTTELRDCMTNYGDKMTQGQVDEMVRMMDMYSGVGDMDKREGVFEYE